MPPATKQMIRYARRLAAARARSKRVKVSLSKISKEKGIGTSYAFKITEPSLPRKEIIGHISYDPELNYLYVGSLDARIKTGLFSGAKSKYPTHKEVSTKILKSGQVRGIVKELSKRFPKATYVRGLRITGMRSLGSRKSIQTLKLKRND